MEEQRKVLSAHIEVINLLDWSSTKQGEADPTTKGAMARLENLSFIPTVTSI